MSHGHIDIYDDDALPKAREELHKLQRDYPAFDEFVNEDFSFSHKWDIPWVAGRNLSCSRIYVDRHCQIIRRLKRIPGGDLRMISVNVTPFLAEHERREFWLMNKLKYEYERAHHIATAAEKEVVEAVGVSWDSYRAEMRKDIKKDNDPQLEKCPPDLDTSPYEEGASRKLLSRVLDSMSKKRRTAHSLFMRR